MYCHHCGSTLTPEARFCPSCGAKTGGEPVKMQTVQTMVPSQPSPPDDKAPVISPPPPPPHRQSQAGLQTPGKPGENPPGGIGWNAAVPIFRGEVFRQLGLVIGIPFGLLAIFLLVSAGGEPYGFYGAGLITALLFLTWLFIRIVYRGKYDAEFVLDEKGALYRTEAKQAKKNRLINSLTVILGFLSGKPVVAGAGMLAGSRQNVFISWKRLTKVTYKPHSRTILLRAGWAENIGLFCTEENYAPVEKFVRNKTEHLLGG